MRFDTVLAGAAGLAFIAAAGYAITQELQRARVDEAAENIAMLFRATAEYHALEHPAPGPALGVHRCPHAPGQVSADTGLTPPLEVRCSDGPGGRCTPVSDRQAAAEGPGVYDPRLWRDDPVWSALQFRKYERHRFHFAYEARNEPPGPDGVSACAFTVTASADLDGDGRPTVYRRSGVADRDGVRPTGPLERLQ